MYVCNLIRSYTNYNAFHEQIWCGAYTKQGMESQIKTGVHSPNRFRVRGALHNSREFAEVWNCPRPEEKSACRIW